MGGCGGWGGEWGAAGGMANRRGDEKRTVPISPTRTARWAWKGDFPPAAAAAAAVAGGRGAAISLLLGFLLSLFPSLPLSPLYAPVGPKVDVGVLEKGGNWVNTYGVGGINLRGSGRCEKLSHLFVLLLPDSTAGYLTYLTNICPSKYLGIPN